MKKFLVFGLIALLLMLSFATAVSATTYNYRPGRAWYHGSDYPVYNTFPAAQGYLPGGHSGNYFPLAPGSPSYFYSFYPGHSYGPTYLHRGVHWGYPTSYGGYPGYFGGWGYAHGYRWGGYGYATTWPNPSLVQQHYAW